MSNLLAFIAIILWSTGSTIISYLYEIPKFEILFFSFFIPFIFIAIKIHVRKEWSSIKNTSYSSWIVVLLISLQQIMYILSFQYVSSPAEVDMIVYLWPILTIIFANIILKLPFKIRYILSGLLGLIGIYLIVYQNNKMSISFNPGHLLALSCAIIWSIYTVLSRLVKNININTIGISYCVGAIISAFLHYKLEIFILPTLRQAMILIYYSTFLSLISYIIWSKAIKNGNINFLSLLAYTKPIFAISCLYIFQLTLITPSIIKASVIIFIASVVANDKLYYSIKNHFYNTYLTKIYWFMKISKLSENKNTS